MANTQIEGRLTRLDWAIKKLENSLSESGSYTPTLSTISNIGSLSASEAQWTKNGNYVTVYGIIALNTLAGSAITSTVEITLPFVTAMTTADKLVGLANPQDETIGSGAFITGNVAGTKASMTFTAAQIGGTNYFYTFRYLIQP